MKYVVECVPHESMERGELASIACRELRENQYTVWYDGPFQLDVKGEVSLDILIKLYNKNISLVPEK